MALRDVEGQDRAVRILSGMLLKNRIASSYLFVGPSGTGKEFTAFQFSKALNCTATSWGAVKDSCDRCNSCRKIESLIHPDIKIIVPENGMIRIEKIRHLDEFLSLTPLEGKKKIVLVDDADTMNPQAGNAFLKTLEEPPADSTIILLSTQLEGLLPTLVSRCLKISFIPLSQNACRNIMQKKGISVNDTEIGMLSGSIDPLLSEEYFLRRERYFKIFTEMIAGDRSEQWSSREEAKEWFEIACSILRDMAIIKSGGSSALIWNERKSELSDICKTVDVKGIINCYEKLNDLSRYVTLNLNRGILLKFVTLIVKDTFSDLR